jgi:protein TonB
MNRLTSTVWLLAAALSACGQQKAPRLLVAAKPKLAPEKVYTYVEQMPQLPGGGGQQAIDNEIMKRLRIPAFALEGQLPETRVRFSFVVATDGSLQNVKIVNSTRSAAIDKAILNAVYSLPCFIPGYQNGRPVSVQLIIPMGLEYR